MGFLQYGINIGAVSIYMYILISLLVLYLYSVLYICVVMCLYSKMSIYLFINSPDDVVLAVEDGKHQD